MLAVTLGQSLARRLDARRDSRAALVFFAGTLFVSALLLFSVQPMFAKMVLPRLGGSPSVWAVSMCFFQAALLGGYCYAHALNRFATPRMAPIIHLTLMGVALLALPIGLPATWPEPPAGDAYLWLIGTLAVGVGLPFFVVSANAPLIQSWFARSGHPHAADPYFLYGASNLGSLIALLAYPVLLEPMAGLNVQASLWSTGFLVLGAGLTGCGLLMALNQRHGRAPSETVTNAEVAEPLAWSRRLSWIGLAALPSGLLVAFSSFVTTDIASAPFLWVLPLALFLATFILVFCETPKIPHRILLALQPAMVAGVLFGLATPGDFGWLMAMLCGTGAFFVTTMVAHRELYEQRPAPTHLTEFYLWMSFGGVVGGVFAALIAPQLFSTIWEFPVLIVAGMACRPGVMTARPDNGALRELLITSLGALLVLIAVGAAMRTGLLGNTSLLSVMIYAGFGLIAMLAVRQPLRQLIATALLGLALVILPSNINRGNAERSFFGVHRVTYAANGQIRLLMHGTTIHGAERLVDASTGARLPDPVPATYYHPGSPMAQIVDVARRASSATLGGLDVGIVGLGAGSMACYSSPAETWRFYEIDPVVVRIARDPKRFTFIERCRPHADIVIGDARLTLTKEPAGKFDYLVVDAFSSDSVPVHLLTVEAVTLYLDKLAPEGILAMHVSNRHLDLVAVAAAVTRAVPGALTALADDRTPDRGYDTAQSHVVLVSKSRKALDYAAKLPFMMTMPEPSMRPWTDDYSDILTPMLRNIR